MDLPKYDGNIHPDEWIKDIQKYFRLNRQTNGDNYLDAVVLFVDSTISLPTRISSFEELRNALKEDISFTVFKNTNKRKLQSLKYIPEREGGDTSRFISTFRKLCYNTEINDVEEQKKYLYNSLPMNHFNYISNEFKEKMKNVNSIEELIKEFEDIILEESILIKNGSTVALKHVATGKYLSSTEHLWYTTGSKNQPTFAGSSEPNLNSLWKISFSGPELAKYTDTITLQHIQSKSNYFLGMWFNGNYYCKSPSTEHTEVSLISYGYGDVYWKFNHSKLKNHQGYLKSDDTINLSVKKRDGKEEFLRSHDIQFTIGNSTFQEVVCHNERLGGNDEWCIELVNNKVKKI